LSTSAGKIAALSVSSEKGVAKNNVDEVVIKEGFGIEGDAHGGPWHRQVSLLAMASVRKMLSKGADVRPGSFGENITTDFIDLEALRIGDRIRSADVMLEITQLGKECHEPCAIYYQVGDCVMPKEGIFARVVSGGVLRVGDEIKVEAPESETK
jgi:molybdopterin adenylyltransferase